MKQEIVVKRRHNPFVQIDNAVFSDNRVSFKAKGILAYLLSKPDGWVVRIEDLYAQTTEGYGSIRSGINELLLAGYMEMRTKVDREGGLFNGRKYYVYEVPLFREGWRENANKNKNFNLLDEPLVYENPLGNRKVYKEQSDL